MRLQIPNASHDQRQSSTGHSHSDTAESLRLGSTGRASSGHAVHVCAAARPRASCCATGVVASCAAGPVCAGPNPIWPGSLVGVASPGERRNGVLGSGCGCGSEPRCAVWLVVRKGNKQTREMTSPASRIRLHGKHRRLRGPAGQSQGYPQG
jgi:hypothetical protein